MNEPARPIGRYPVDRYSLESKFNKGETTMFKSILREVKDIAGQLARLDYGWLTLANVIKQIACYAKYRSA